MYLCVIPNSTEHEQDLIISVTSITKRNNTMCLCVIPNSTEREQAYTVVYEELRKAVLIEAQYCVILCPYGTTKGRPSRACPRAGPSPLRSTSARRRRRGPHTGARGSSPLSTQGQWALVGTSPPPGFYVPACCPRLAAQHPGPQSRAGSPIPRFDPVSCGVRVALLGPLRRRRRLA
jgi:hypothetical protein